MMPILIKPYFKQGKHFAKAVKKENCQNSTISLRKGYFARPFKAGTAPVHAMSLSFLVLGIFNPSVVN